MSTAQYRFLLTSAILVSSTRFRSEIRPTKDKHPALSTCQKHREMECKTLHQMDRMYKLHLTKNLNKLADSQYVATDSVTPFSDVDLEEGRIAYKPDRFHPVYIGDIYSGRYLVLSKLGKGNNYYALKVLSAECYGTGKDIFEREILRHLRDADKTHVGYKYTCHLIDDFEHHGPNGAHISIPAQEKLDVKYSPIPSQSLKRFYFTSHQLLLDFEVTLGDSGVASWADNHLSELIQPVPLRAPEVLIKAPWDATTDWWNLGPVILEVFRCVRMFEGRGPPHGHYDLKQHLLEMVAYFGPFPRTLLEKGDPELVKTYFDESGFVRDSTPLELPSLESDGYMDDLDEVNRKLFVSLLHALMKIDPQERLSTMDLLRYPWLGIGGL
ncbi:kinase-like domain-containing protein [Xylariales sp. PMI_506]|nr:kinase-like domain-containing protein [Xylariales sp. PMI_506]